MAQWKVRELSHEEHDSNVSLTEGTSSSRSYERAPLEFPFHWVDPPFFGGASHHSYLLPPKK